MLAFDMGAYYRGLIRGEETIETKFYTLHRAYSKRHIDLHAIIILKQAICIHQNRRNL